MEGSEGETREGTQEEAEEKTEDGADEKFGQDSDDDIGEDILRGKRRVKRRRNVCSNSNRIGGKRVRK